MLYALQLMLSVSAFQLGRAGPHSDCTPAGFMFGCLQEQPTCQWCVMPLSLSHYCKQHTRHRTVEESTRLCGVRQILFIRVSVAPFFPPKPNASHCQSVLGPAFGDPLGSVVEAVLLSVCSSDALTRWQHLSRQCHTIFSFACLEPCLPPHFEQLCPAPTRQRRGANDLEKPTSGLSRLSLLGQSQESSKGYEIATDNFGIGGCRGQQDKCFAHHHLVCSKWLMLGMNGWSRNRFT